MLLEVRFIYRAERAHPIGGQVFELVAGGNAVLGVAFCGVILIPAYVANILFHLFWFLKVNSILILFMLNFPFRPVNLIKILLYANTQCRYIVSNNVPYNTIVDFIVTMHNMVAHTRNV